MNYKSKITSKMKKVYLTPLAEVVKMQAEVMICASPDGEVFPGGNGGEGDW